ncbi:hypothetical protein OPV22_003128 [Ensete ventricosum]|uniref:Uncharacterized protein n=1 Tax=Ensete ventricosum TaxID=4639 RepID=A0AAV8S032_ENSVE|nr:hypothetical protein OPV22_003128 [Ensete ventricosum]
MTSYMYTISAAIRAMRFITWHKNQLGFSEVGAEGTHTKPLVPLMVDYVVMLLGASTIGRTRLGNCGPEAVKVASRLL